MLLHELKSPSGSRKRRKIVGRGPGSHHGKTSCRGQKGQGARAGRGILNSLEGGQVPLIRRISKVGFNSKNPILYKLITLDSLSVFSPGNVVTAVALKEKGLIKSLYRPFKIMGTGDINKALTVQAYAFSKTAAAKIEQAGGKVEKIDRKMIHKMEQEQQK